jgi:hypothetical protein
MLAEFGTLLSDLPPIGNMGATVANNVIPFGNTYKSFPSLSVVSSNALDTPCLGAFATRDSAGNPLNFCGDTAKLYLLSSGSLTDVSKVGGYATGSTEKWNFVKFNQYVIGTNYTDAIQKYDVEIDTDFSDLAATAPKARYIAVVRDFVVLGNIDDSVDGQVPNRVQWSAIGNPSGAWTPSATTQADIQDLPGDGGWVMNVIGGEYGVIFRERSIHKMSYIGSPLIFQFDEIEGASGTPASRSCVKFGRGNNIFYLGRDGFYIFDGQQSNPIGVNQIDKTFYADVNQSYMGNIVAVADEINSIIMMAYPSLASSSGVCDKVIMYNYSPNATKRWAFADMDSEFLFIFNSEGYTMDSLDGVNNNLDLITPSLDSRIWTGGASYISAFNIDNELTTLTGAALEATIETGEIEINPGRATRLREVKPLIEGATSAGAVTVQIGVRDDGSDTVTWGGVLSNNNAGNFPCRTNANYHRMRVVIDGGFDFAQGIEMLEQTPGGKR